MKTVRLLLSVLIACAFLASGMTAHAGAGTDRGGHGTPVMVTVDADPGHHHGHEHDGYRSVHHSAGHGDAGCCVAGGGCGFVVLGHFPTRAQRIDFIVFEVTDGSASSRASPPDFPPPRPLA